MDLSILRPILLIFLLLILSLSASNAYSTPSETLIKGVVRDSVSGDPLAETLVIAFRVENKLLTLYKQTRTDKMGRFQLSIPSSDFVYLALVKDEEGSEGLDYVPVLLLIPTGKREILVEEELVPAGTVFIVVGTVLKFLSYERLVVWPILDYEIPNYDYSNYLRLIDTIKGCRDLYSRLADVIMLSEGIYTLCIPANVSFTLHLTLYDHGTRVLIKHAKKYTVDKGAVLKLDLREEIMLMGTMKTVEVSIADLERELELLENAHVDVRMERGKLVQLRRVLGRIHREIRRDRYSLAGMYFKEVRKLLRDIETSLKHKRISCRYMLAILLVLSLVLSLAISSFITPIGTLKWFILSVISYLLLSTILHLHPLSTIGREYSTFFSTLFLFTLLFALSRVLKLGRKPTSTFGLALTILALSINNMKKRKIRSFIMALSIMVISLSFLTIVEVSSIAELRVEENEISRKESILSFRWIDRRAPRPNFIPLDYSVVEYLKERLSIELISIKAESLPKAWNAYLRMQELDEYPEPLGYVVREDLRVELEGILGIVPDVESKFVDLSDLISHGRFFRKHEQNGVVVSDDIALILDLSIGDEILVHVDNLRIKLIVKGILNSSRLASLIDLDGLYYTPLKLEFTTVPSTTGELKFVPIRARPVVKRLIIVNLEKAIDMGCVLSRIAILPGEPRDLSTLCKSIVEETRLDVWYIRGGKVRHYYIIESLEIIGGPEFSILLVMLSLIVALTTIGILYERKRDLSIISTLGFNPTHLWLSLSTEVWILLILPTIASIEVTMLGLPLISRIIPITLSIDTNPIWIISLLLAISIVSIISSTPIALASIKTLAPNIPFRWKFELRDLKNIALPLRLKKEEASSFLKFISSRLREEANLPIIEGSKELVVAVWDLRTEGHEKDLYLSFKISFHTSWRYFRASCKLRLYLEDRYYVLSLHVEPIDIYGFHKEHVSYHIGELMRRLVLEWAIERGVSLRERGT